MGNVTRSLAVGHVCAAVSYFLDADIGGTVRLRLRDVLPAGLMVLVVSAHGKRGVPHRRTAVPPEKIRRFAMSSTGRAPLRRSLAPRAPK